MLCRQAASAANSEADGARSAVSDVPQGLAPWAMSPVRPVRSCKEQPPHIMRMNTPRSSNSSYVSCGCTDYEIGSLSAGIAGILHALATTSDPGDLGTLCHYMERTGTDAPVGPALAGASNWAMCSPVALWPKITVCPSLRTARSIVDIDRRVAVPVVMTSLDCSERGETVHLDLTEGHARTLRKHCSQVALAHRIWPTLMRSECRGDLRPQEEPPLGRPSSSSTSRTASLFFLVRW